MGGDHQSVKPSSMPTSQPTSLPSQLPSVSKSPSEVPSGKPSVNPSLMPSVQPSVCRDEFEWRVGGSSIYKGMTCKDIDSDPERWCAFLQKIPDASYGGKSISEACCECGGGDHQTIFPSLSPSASPSLTSSPSFVVVPSESPSTCSDELGWTFTADDEELNLGCDALQENLCSVVEHIIFGLKPASAACCVSHYLQFFSMSNVE